MSYLLITARPLQSTKAKVCSCMCTCFLSVMVILVVLLVLFHFLILGFNQTAVQYRIHILLQSQLRTNLSFSLTRTQAIIVEGHWLCIYTPRWFHVRFIQYLSVLTILVPCVLAWNESSPLPYNFEGGKDAYDCITQVQSVERRISTSVRISKGRYYQNCYNAWNHNMVRY